MAEEVKQDTTTTTQATPAQSTSTETAKTGNDTRYTDADVERIVKERLEREKVKSAEAAKKAAETAAAETAAKNGEWEKVAKAKEQELEQTKAQLKARDLADRKRAIAEKTGLPAQLASRLVGETDEEIEKDAKALLETLPKPQKPTVPGTNPGVNGSTQETREQKKARLEGKSIDPFGAGGGVNWGEKPPEG